MVGKGVTMDRDPTLSANGSSRGGEELSPHAVAFDDARMEVIMGRLLQVGVLLSASVVLVGGVMYLAAHAATRASYRVFTANPIQLRHPAAMLRGIARGDASAIVELGILLLVATPICRVVFAVIAFAIQRDRLYVTISLTVLAVLLLGMVRGS
jgi:uncharacterized membrane protein